VWNAFTTGGLVEDGHDGQHGELRSWTPSLISEVKCPETDTGAERRSTIGLFNFLYVVFGVGLGQVFVHVLVGNYEMTEILPVGSIKLRLEALKKRIRYWVNKGKFSIL
jgi:hypothetical protein